MKKINILIAMLVCCFLTNDLLAQFSESRREAGTSSSTQCFTSETPGEVVVLNPEIKTTKFTPTTTNPPPPPPPPTFDRLIFMIHGLGGGVDTWAKASHAIQGGASGFPARKATALRPTYSEFTLPGAGIDLHNALVAYDPHMQEGMDPLYNFVIASSQGGLAARFCDKYEQTIEPERRFNGIVTFGTPHQGAKILNNVPKLIDMVEDGIIALAAGPVTEEIETSLVLDAFTGAAQGMELVTGVANFAADNIVPIMMSQYLSPITEDYKVGAAPINQINNTTSNVHKVAFYGVEDEPVLWRTQSSLSVQPPNESNYFSANNDEAIVTIANENRSSYYGKYQSWKNTVDDWNFWDAINIFDGLTKSEAKKIRDAYYKGYNWWNQANSRYKSAIGAISFDYTQSEVCECLEFNGPGGSYEDMLVTFPGPCTTNITNQYDYCFSSTQTIYTQVHKKSDGVVLEESAGGYPGASTVYKLPGSNHQQMRNDPNTKDALLKLFNGEFDPYFQTDPM